MATDITAYLVVFKNGHCYQVSNENPPDKVVSRAIYIATHANTEVAYIRNHTTNQIIYSSDFNLPNAPGKSVVDDLVSALDGSFYLGATQRPQCDHDWKELHLFTSSEISCTKCGIKK